jgi:hypothetical protein
MYVDASGSAGKQRWTCEGSALFIVFSASHFFFFLFSEPERAVI